MAKKHIEMFLLQGTLEGIIQCTLSGWAGSAYRVPRVMLAEAAKIQELSRSGVYCLLNEETGEAYVGQGGKRRDDTGVLKRVSRHDIASEKYWDTAIAFVSRGNNLSQTEISYLEHRFYKLAKAAKRFDVKNGQVPPDGTPGPGVICNMDCFIEGALLVMQTMGHKLFNAQKAYSVSSTQPSTAPAGVYTLSRLVDGEWQTKASGKFNSDGKFVVLSGSILAPTKADRKCLSKPLLALRAEYCLPNDLAVLRQDVEFTSLSNAANFVIGNQVNGKDYWKPPVE